MRIYLADSSTSLDTGLAAKSVSITYPWRILLSYHYYKNADLDAVFTKHFVKPYPEVFLDSGAFSAFTKGEIIDINTYCDFIKKFKHLITTYSNLDVIGSASGTLANQRKMEKQGLNPLPVFHTNEDWPYLEGYISDYSYIALGGMVPYLKPDKRNILMKWLLKAFRLAEGKSVYHGFGCTAWNVVCAFPWYSVDSSSWGAGFRFGKISLFDERNGRFVDAHLGDHKTCFKYAALFRSMGFNPADFADRKRNERAKNCAIAALSYIRAEQWLERRHGPITIPERNETPV